MPTSTHHSLSLAQKLGMLLSIALLLVLGLATLLLGNWLGNRIEARAIGSLQTTNQQVIDTIDAYARVLEGNARQSASLLATTLPRPLRVDASGATPAL